MARGKPLTRFLLALCHSPELASEFNSDRRDDLIKEWGLADNDLFRSDDLTLEQVQAAVAAEHKQEGANVEVAWWIWFMSGPTKRPKPDWVWGVEEDKPDGDDNGTNGDDADNDDGEGSGGGAEGRSQPE